MTSPSTLPFEKWQGTGNDFVICSHRLATEFAESVTDLAKAICDRHYGIGADGLILIGKSDTADFRMQMWNPDGSESEMCGNGLRCVGMHLLGHRVVDGSMPVTIETIGRINQIKFIPAPDWVTDSPAWVQVDMGEPVLDRKAIPIATDGNSPVIEEELAIPGIPHPLKYTAVNFGNPHAIIFVDSVDEVQLQVWGPSIENHTEVFPSRVNAEFVKVISPEHVRMRVWERGAGETLSCGSGTAAVQTACHLTGKAGDVLRVDPPGGSLMTEFTGDGHVLLSGPAARTFAGVWPS
jgi:diaminopimelate epimerase